MKSLKPIIEQAAALTTPRAQLAKEQRNRVEEMVLDTMLSGGEPGALFTLLSMIEQDYDNPAIDVLAANCNTLFVNPAVSSCLSNGQLWTILHHELFHIRNRHTTRCGRLVKAAKDRGDTTYLKIYHQVSNVFLDVFCDTEVVRFAKNQTRRNRSLPMNMDIDFAQEHLDFVRGEVDRIIAEVVEESKVQWADSPRLGDLRSDEVYLLDSFVRYIRDNHPSTQSDNGGDTTSGYGDVIVTAEDIDTNDAQLIATLQAVAKMHGDVCGDWKMDIPQPDTRPLMADIIKEVADKGNTHYSGAEYDQEMAGGGIIVPTKCLSDNKPVAVLFDVSGSVVCSDQEFAFLLGQLQQINERTPVLVLPFDTTVKDPIWADDGEALQAMYNIRAGGGTSFDPPVRALNEMAVQFSAAIMLTDGQARYTQGLSTRTLTWISSDSDTRQLDRFGDHYQARLS